MIKITADRIVLYHVHIRCGHCSCCRHCHHCHRCHHFNVAIDRVAANDATADIVAITAIAAVDAIAAIAAVTALQDTDFIFKESFFNSISNNLQPAKKLAAAAGNNN